jgi:hypothetical protein
MITFVDQIGRTVIGKLVEETESTITVDNPVIIHVQPNPQTGQLQVQSFPYLFMEFINKDSRDQNQWTFFKSSIAVSKVTLDERIISQYSNINTPPEPQPEPEVIKLFEE